jgi:hypothetical protein
MFGMDQNLLPAIFCGVTFSAVVIIAYCIPRSASRILKEITKTNELRDRMLAHMAAATTRGEVTQARRAATGSSRATRRASISTITMNEGGLTKITFRHYIIYALINP